jgi:PAS domain S-box-containing protein/putative nucleotidyltransferase with HDIG domain
MVPSPPRDREKDISSQWLLALVESALDGIIAMDDKGRIIAFNPAAEKMFGYPKDQVVGRRVSEMIVPESLCNEHQKGTAHHLTAGMKKLIGRRVEISAKRADQSIFPAEIEVLSVQEKNPAVFMAYVRDISNQKQAEQEQRKYALNIRKTLVQTILAMSRMVEIRDPYTAGHQSRVAHLAAAMAETLQLSGECIEGVFLGALIHDIGKIAVPSEILSRPGKLRNEDINYLQIHCLKGYDILNSVEFPWPVAQIAHQHHEHVDGSGYPQGLRGEEIRQEARIVCVADVVESLTAHRPYRPAYPLDEALRFIRDKAGKWYDRTIVKACRKLFKSGYHIDAIDMDALTWISWMQMPEQ